MPHPTKSRPVVLFTAATHVVAELPQKLLQVFTKVTQP